MNSLENQYLEESRNRKQYYIRQAYFSGLEDRQVEAIEAIYFGKQGVDLKGYHTDDIDLAIRYSNKHKEMTQQEDNFRRFEDELRRIYGDLDRLELTFLEGSVG